MKKYVKYILYVLLGLVVVYLVFRATRENFTSVNPLPTAKDYADLTTAIKTIGEEDSKNQVQYNGGDVGAKYIAKAPNSIRTLANFIKSNVIPLLPYEIAKNLSTPQGDMTDVYIIIAIQMSAQFMPQIAYEVSQSPSAPSYADWVPKIVNAVTRGSPVPSEAAASVEAMKSYTPTVTVVDPQTKKNITIPNPPYWMYKYIYGDQPISTPKVDLPVVKMGTAAGQSNPTPGPDSSCHPTYASISGGTTETRCFTE